jgi:rod shape-determining protein MreD
VSLQLGLPLVILGAMLQSAVLPHLRVFGGQPDLVLLVVLAWAMLDPGREGMAWAFAGGLLLDLFSGAPLGVSSLALLPVAYVIGLTEAQIYRSNVVMPLVLGAGGALAYHLMLLLGLRFLAGYPVVWSTGFWYVTLPSVLFDVILMIPVLRVLTRWYDRLHPRQVTL